MSDASVPLNSGPDKPRCLRCGEHLTEKELGWFCPCSPTTYWTEGDAR